MKRSEMIKKLSDFLFYNDTEEVAKGNADRLLTHLEYEGMLPPKIPVKKVRPSDYRWGAGCTMRCICEECTPEFLVTEWEPEDETK